MIYKYKYKSIYYVYNIIMSNKYCVIYYDSERMKIEKTKNIIKHLQLIVKTFKNMLEMIDNFQKLIIKLTEEQFNVNDNIKYSKKVLLNNIKLLYDNIILLLNNQFNNVQIINFSMNDIIPLGYSINYINSLQHINSYREIHVDDSQCNTINYANTLIYINSYKIKYSENGIIKIVEYDKDLIPTEVYFLGTHINLINNSNFHDRLSKCYNNNLATIGYIKVVLMKYIQIIENLQNIYK